MNMSYQPLVSASEEAHKIHVHETTVLRETPGEEPKHYAHAHAAEEAVYFLEGRATVHLEGRPQEVGPGDMVFFPAHREHGPIVTQSERLRYLVVRSVEAGDPPCCCEKTPHTG